MEHLECPPVAERLYALSLIWQEANYNFAFFDCVPGLDWEAKYREFIPRVIAAEDANTYCDLLERFVALLEDGHSLVAPPRAFYLSQDRPKIALMRVGGAPIVTNASQAIASRVPIGSELLEVDGMKAGEYLSACVLPVVCESTAHRRRDHATARILLGPQDRSVHCKFQTPDGGGVDIDLPRNRRADPTPWLRPFGAPAQSEFMYFDEWVYRDTPLKAFDFERLEGGVGYVALNSFLYPDVLSAFEEKLPILKDCAGIILDLRKNHGGNDDFGNRIVAHFLRQPTETSIIHTQKHIAVRRARGVNVKDTPVDKVAGLSAWDQDNLRCYRHQWYHEDSWGNLEPAQEIIPCPVVLLTSSETGSAAEDFLMAFQSGKGNGVRMGGATAGSTGQPLMEMLPGGAMFGICTVRMSWALGIRRTGIVPDIPVEPTVDDVIHGEDRALRAAARYLQGA